MRKIGKWGSITEDENGILIISNFHLLDADKHFPPSMQLLMEIKRRIDDELETMLDNLEETSE